MVIDQADRRAFQIFQADLPERKGKKGKKDMSSVQDPLTFSCTD